MLSWDAIKYLKKGYTEIKKAFKDYKKWDNVKLSKDNKIILCITALVLVIIAIAVYRMIFCPVSDAEMISSSILLAALLLIMATNK